MIKRIIKTFPVISTLLLEGSTIGHIHQMWRYNTALGQSLISWIFVLIALILYYIWYSVITPDQKIVRYTTLFSICITCLALGTVVWFK